MPRCQTTRTGLPAEVASTLDTVRVDTGYKRAPVTAGPSPGSWWQRLCSAWADAPPCALCEGACQAGMLLCAGCHRDLPWLDADRCPRCGDAAPPSGGGGAQACCERCRRDPPPCTVRLAALDYRFPVDAMVRRLKFEGGLWLVPVLAGLLLERCSGAQRPDCLLPVPLSDRRLAERGFNQSAEIARVLGRHTGIPLQPLLLRRARDTRPQSGLPLAERTGNLRGAFVVDQPVRGLHVALVDDVATTGTTGAEAARALLREGAARVDLWTVAQTLRGHDG